MAALALYFPGSFRPASRLLSSPIGSILLDHLVNMPTDPITLARLNQLVHLVNEMPVSEGFFRYYFLTVPQRHPYSLDRMFPSVPGLNPGGISSLEQLRWGLHRFFLDGLLYFGDLRKAYHDLHRLTDDQLQQFFETKRFNSTQMQARGPALAFNQIPADDRYLIAEIACKAYSPIGDGTKLLVEDLLLKAYRAEGGGSLLLKKLFGEGSKIAADDPQVQMMLEFATEEYADDTVEHEEDIRGKIQAVAERFSAARASAVANTRLYLSLVNELDIYVATSMRKRHDFREMHRQCNLIFKQDGLSRFHIRYFDPTLSAADGHEDKGLIECLMVKCTKALLYFAGEGDSFGKDAEVAMALSLGKPVIILCPPTPKGEQRMKFFRDVHPLSRMIQMDTGVAVGAMVTNDPIVVAHLLERLFDNRMEYDLDQAGDGYFRVRERRTGSVVRLQTNFAMLRESLRNYYDQNE